jgi:L-threonylcarbamoyladenylate synthase
MDNLTQVVESLRQGKIIAYPTEGVWGLGCDPMNEKAVNGLLSLKERPIEKGLILIGSDLKHFDAFAKLQEYKHELLTKWPGPHTWIVPTDISPEWITGGKNSVALRLSSYKPVEELCSIFGGAIVSTSANRTGEIPAKTEEEISALYPEIDIYSKPLGGFEGATPIQDVVSGNMVRES